MTTYWHASGRVDSRGHSLPIGDAEELLSLYLEEAIAAYGAGDFDASCGPACGSRVLVGRGCSKPGTQKMIIENHEIKIFRCRSVGESFTAGDWQARENLIAACDAALNLAAKLDDVSHQCAKRADSVRSDSAEVDLLARAATYAECAGLLRHALRTLRP